MSFNTRQWNRSSEYRRGELLRDALADVQSAHAAESRRLRSSISELQGTLQSKLEALSTAFDAYVELGDVREQLAELPDWSHTRRAVEAALTTLMAGDIPEPLSADEHDHWLADAMNAVVELVQGSDPSHYEHRAGAGSDQAALFIVATALALGAGENLDGRLARLFAGLTTLDEDHVVLLRAAAAGLTGMRELELLGEQLAPALDDMEMWRPWLGLDTARPSGYLELENFLATGRRLARRRNAPTHRENVEAPWQYEDLEARLSERAALLARSGSKDEAALRTRAAHLRERVEDPTGKARPLNHDVAAIPVVQSILDHPDTPEESLRVIAGWLRAPLLGVVRAWQELGPGPALTSTYTQLWSVPGTPFRRIRLEVTQDGVDAKDQRREEQFLQAAEHEGGSPKVMFAAALAVAAVGLISLMLGDGWVALAILLLIAAVVLAVLGVLRKRTAVRIELAKAEAVRTLREGVRDEARDLRQKEIQRIEDAAATTAAIDDLLRRLEAPGRSAWSRDGGVAVDVEPQLELRGQGGLGAQPDAGAGDDRADVGDAIGDEDPGIMRA